MPLRGAQKNCIPNCKDYIQLCEVEELNDVHLTLQENAIRSINTIDN